MFVYLLFEITCHVISIFGSKYNFYTVKVLPMHIIEEADRGLWRGRNPSKVKDGEVKFGAGFQPVFMVQIYPPAPCTALVANASLGL